MAYAPDTIAHLVTQKLNRTHFLPDIQREFEWDQMRICQLFDSIMRQYPLSSFLFWDIAAEKFTEFDSYKFIENFEKGVSTNEIANLEAIPLATLVLDGQQRLTSMLIALRGSYSYRTRGRYAKTVREKLYLNLLHDPELLVDEDDGELGLRYEFKFRSDNGGLIGADYWYSVGTILSIADMPKLQSHISEVQERLPDHSTKKQLNLISATLNVLWSAIWQSPAIFYHTETNPDNFKVLDIFVRANAGGVKLTKSDLLLSLLTAQWGVKHLKAREEMKEFLRQVNAETFLKNNFDKDFVLKASLALADLNVEYRLENFSPTNLGKIADEWESIKGSIRNGVELVNRFGLNGDTLTSANAVIPFCYFFHKNPRQRLLESQAKDAAILEKLRLWLLLALLNRVFSGQSDRMISGIREKLREAPEFEFPFEAVSEAALQRGKRLKFDQDLLDSLMALEYGNGNTFLALASLAWSVTTRFQQHVDHIYPLALFKNSNPEFAKLSGVQKQKYKEEVNSIANLQILRDIDNIVKNDQEPSKWINLTRADFRTQHLIPDGHPLTFATFSDFMEQRERLLRARFQEVFKEFSAPTAASVTNNE